jgi:phosphate:Na+ symporter
VLLGADLGTTITAWIVALKVTRYGLPLLGLSGFFYLFARRERVRFIAMTIMGIGMIFFGLSVMKHGLKPISESEAFIQWFSRFSPHNYAGLLKCVVVGSLVTAVMQSSSATVAITIMLAVSGVITFETSVALVLGQNIGTTITAYLAALGASSAAKRTAYAHILIKVIGVAVVVPFFFVYMDILNWLMPAALASDIGKQIAYSHTVFNIFIVVLFLPLVGLLVYLLMKLVPGKARKETPHLTFLDAPLAETPTIAIQQSGNEVLTMRDGVAKMMVWLRAEMSSTEDDPERRRKLLHREEVLDVIQKEIVEFISKIVERDISHDVVVEARRQLRNADEYESISDYIVTLFKLFRKHAKLETAMMVEDRESILALHDRVAEYLQMIGQALEAEDRDIMSRARSEGHIIVSQFKQARNAHLARIDREHVTAAHTLIITDILQCYRKIKDHALNIAETVAGEK